MWGSTKPQMAGGPPDVGAQIPDVFKAIGKQLSPVNASGGDDGGGDGGGVHQMQPAAPAVHVRLADGRLVHVPYSEAGGVAGAAAGGAPTVSSLKDRLAQLTGVERGHQRLVFAGVELKDDARALDECGVASGTELHMLPHPPPPPIAGGTNETDVAAAAAAAAAAVVAAPPPPPPGPATSAASSSGTRMPGDPEGAAAAAAAALAASEEKMRALRASHRKVVEDHRRRLLGVRFDDVEVKRVLGSGCNGAVLDCVVRGVPVALKIMFNYGQSTTLVADLHTTEYRFLQHVPEHWNVVPVLGVIPASPMTANLAEHLPEAAREAATQVNRRTGATRYRSTTGLLLERLPITLEEHVSQLGAALDGPQVVSLGAQVVEALHHLHQHGVVHGDVKTNNLMVDLSTAPPRVVLVDFGCAVVRGDGVGDMDEAMRAYATAGSIIGLGNQAHLAPEVLAALGEQGKLKRGSDARVPVPLAKQGAFAAGTALFEVACGLDQPVPDYPRAGNDARAFAAVDVGVVREVAGDEFADVVLALLAFDPAARMPLSEARRRLTALASRVVAGTELATSSGSGDSTATATPATTFAAAGGSNAGGSAASGATAAAAAAAEAATARQERERREEREARVLRERAAAAVAEERRRDAARAAAAAADAVAERARWQAVVDAVNHKVDWVRVNVWGARGLGVPFGMLSRDVAVAAVVAGTGRKTPAARMDSKGAVAWRAPMDFPLPPDWQAPRHTVFLQVAHQGMLAQRKRGQLHVRLMDLLTRGSYASGTLTSGRHWRELKDGDSVVGELEMSVEIVKGRSAAPRPPAPPTAATSATAGSSGGGAGGSNGGAGAGAGVATPRVVATPSPSAAYPPSSSASYPSSRHHRHHAAVQQPVRRSPVAAAPAACGGAVRLQVTIPANARPGQPFLVSFHGRVLHVECPPGAVPGQVINVQVPNPQ